jgi:hypothetical protein
VSGSVEKISGRCPAVTFVINTMTIVADSNTEYRKGNCSDLGNGRDVVVTGTVQLDRTLQATRIELKKAKDD